VTDLPPGIRNNNPGNLRPDPNYQWAGATGVSGGIVTFGDSLFGIRALALDLFNKNTRDGLNTLEKLISKYAPENENDTASYVKTVASKTALKADAEISLRDASTCRKIITEIIAYENGPAPDDWHTFPTWYAEKNIIEGMNMTGRWPI
jgi:hypothetical protein